jgi:tRNA A-37 threonylcarbamoyl transferase component Bud32
VTPERWQRITQLFHRARAQPPAHRAAFLAEASADDPSLRAEVESLLAADREAGRFGEAPLIPSIDSSRRPGIETPISGSGELDEEPSVAPRPRHRFVCIVWAVTMATAAAFAYAAWLLVFRSASFASVGWTEERRQGSWDIDAVDAAGPAAGRLQRGDRLISLNGVVPARNAGTRFQRRALTAGEPYALAVDRHGERLEYRLVAVADPDALVDRATYFFISLVWCAVGAFIGFARPERSLARLAFGAAVATGHAYLTGAVIQSGPLWAPLHVVLGYQFFSRFPTDRRPAGIWKGTAAFLYLVATPGAFLGLWLYATLLTKGAAAGTRLLGQHALLFSIFRGSLGWVTYCSGFFAMAAVAAHNYWRLTDEDARRRVRWVAFGAVAALVPQLWSAGLAAYRSWLGPVNLPGFDFAIDILSVAIPISVAYAVVKHRVFDVTVVFRRGVQYLLAQRALQALLALPIAALAYIVVTHRHQTIVELASRNSGYLYWLAAAAVALRYRRPLRMWLDRRFFRQEYDREQLLLVLVDDLSKVESMPELSRLVTADLESALHPKALYLWHREAEGFTLAHSSRSAPDPRFPGGAGLASWLEARATPVDVPVPADARLTRAGSRRLAALGAALIVPIIDSADHLVGVLLLGEKKSEEPYSAGDKRLLQAIAKQTAVAQENLRLRAEVDEERRIRHDVLERLEGRLNVLKECPSCGTCYDRDGERCEGDGQLLTLSLPVARTIDARYRLDRLIGKGGMAAVYEARDLRLDRLVAVKIVLGRAFGRPLLIRRFGREARAAARLNHPNIVSVFDFGRLEGEGAYLVMERVHGITLRAELDRARTLASAAAADWFDQMLDGLTAAHGHGIVHRDLKPENVMAQRDGSASPVVKILDFGLAKTRTVGETPDTGTLTIDGTVMGTSGYMSPEQILGRDVDARSDVFSVGVMVVEALTGRRPFRGETYAEVARAVVETDFRLPWMSAEARAIDDVLQRCLAKDPAQRFSSAAPLRAGLIPALRAGLEAV